jgi:DNA-binding response OmpR family regulator
MRLPRILLVDDEVDLRNVISLHLETRGFEVVGLGDAETALDRLAAETFDAVILDNCLPGMMGITALPRILKLGKTPVIMITGHAADETRRDALLLGAKELMKKPLDLNALAEALGRFIPA